MFIGMRTLVAALFFLSACAAVPPHVEREKLDDMIDEIIAWIAANTDYPVQRAPRILFVDQLPPELIELKISLGADQADAAYVHDSKILYLPTSTRLDIR